MRSFGALHWLMTCAACAPPQATAPPTRAEQVDDAPSGARAPVAELAQVAPQPVPPSPAATSTRDIAEARATCQKICSKVGECMPTVWDALGRVGASQKRRVDETAAAEVEEQQMKKVRTYINECRQTCDERGSFFLEGRDMTDQVKNCVEVSPCWEFIECAGQVK